MLKIDPGPIDAVRAEKPKRLPTVLAKEEAKIIIAALYGVNELVARLLYGSGLRLIEWLRLRVKDLELPIARSRCGMAIAAKTA